MAMNGLEGIMACLQRGVGEIHVPEPVRGQALGCIDRMLAYVASHPEALLTPTQGFVRNLGAA
jgi:quinolinate synthase